MSTYHQVAAAAIFLIAIAAIITRPRRLDEAVAALARKALRALTLRGFREDVIELTYEGDFKFAGQAFEVTVPLPSGSLAEGDREVLTDTFTRSYERLYGPGTAWEGFPVLMLNARVTAVGRVARPALVPAGRDGQVPAGPSDSATRTALVVETGKREPLPAHRGARLRPGTVIRGPALIDDVDTTVYVPVDGRLEVDELRNFRLAL